jgi:hypothetical protein
MAVFLEKPSKFSSPYDLWSKVPVKLMAYIVELRDVYRINAKGIIKSLKSDLVVRLELGSSRAKTEEIHAGMTQVNQFLFLDITESSVDLGAELIVRVKSGKHDVCEANLGRWNKYTFDTIAEVELDLKFPLKDKTKSSPSDLLSRVLGKLRMRLTITKGSGVLEPTPIWNGIGTVPASTSFLECEYFDNNKSLRKSVKTGDLVVYQETGFLGLTMSLVTNSPYSRVGMILRLPDKYTGRERPYVVELTSNPSKFLDVVTEEPSNGMVLFRLWERIRSLQGGSVWLLPLLEPLATDPQANMIEFAQKALATPTNLPDSLTATLPADFLTFIQDLGIKEPATYCELLSASVCAGLLRMGGKRTVDPPTLITVASPKESSSQAPPATCPFLTPLALVSHSDLFGPLIPVRLMEPLPQAGSQANSPQQ